MRSSIGLAVHCPFFQPLPTGSAPASFPSGSLVCPCAWVSRAAQCQSPALPPLLVLEGVRTCYQIVRSPGSTGPGTLGSLTLHQASEGKEKSDKSLHTLCLNLTPPNPMPSGRVQIPSRFRVASTKLSRHSVSATTPAAII